MRTDYVKPIAGSILGADGEGDDGGVVAREEVLAAGLEPRPLLPLRQLREPRRLQPPLRLIDGVEGGGGGVEEVDEVGDDGGDGDGGGGHGRRRQ